MIGPVDLLQLIKRQTSFYFLSAVKETTSRAFIRFVAYDLIQLAIPIKSFALSYNIRVDTLGVSGPQFSYSLDSYLCKYFFLIFFIHLEWISKTTGIQPSFRQQQQTFINSKMKKKSLFFRDI